MQVGWLKTKQKKKHIFCSFFKRTAHSNTGWPRHCAPRRLPKLRRTPTLEPWVHSSITEGTPARVASVMVAGAPGPGWGAGGQEAWPQRFYFNSVLEIIKVQQWRRVDKGKVVAMKGNGGPWSWRNRAISSERRRHSRCAYWAIVLQCFWRELGGVCGPWCHFLPLLLDPQSPQMETLKMMRDKNLISNFWGGI